MYSMWNITSAVSWNQHLEQDYQDNEKLLTSSSVEANRSSWWEISLDLCIEFLLSFSSLSFPLLVRVSRATVKRSMTNHCSTPHSYLPSFYHELPTWQRTCRDYLIKWLPYWHRLKLTNYIDDSCAGISPPADRQTRAYLVRFWHVMTCF